MTHRGVDAPTQQGPVPAPPSQRAHDRSLENTNRPTVVHSVPSRRLRHKKERGHGFHHLYPQLTTRSYPVRGLGTPPMAKSTKKRLLAVRLAKGMAAGSRSPQSFQHAIFASKAEYDQSVESVIARIRSGQVKARTPDE